MSASSSNSLEVPLPESVESILRDICQRQSQPPIKSYARSLLAEIGEQASMQILSMISSQRICSSFSGYIAAMVKKDYPIQASVVLSCFHSSPVSFGSAWSPSRTSPFSSPQNRNAGSRSPESNILQNSNTPNLQNIWKRKIPLSFEDEGQERGSPSIIQQPPLTPDVNNCQLNGVTKTVSQQLLILNKLEFRKLFLVLSYIGRKNLEAVISLDGARDIFSKKDLPMTSFESEIWYSYGKDCCDESDRSEYFDWDLGHLYYCYVNQDGSYHFKGPYLNNTRTHLQRCLGDDNVLIVKFSKDGKDLGNISEGILVGLRRYQFFVFKDERQRKKKVQIEEQITYSSVKCYFVYIDSVVPCIEHNNYILYGKNVTEARGLFMHIHKVKTIEKYMARFSLILSKTVKLPIDFHAVKVVEIDDIPFKDENGNIIYDEDGEPLLHTDGTGFISEDLALKCPKDFSEAMYIKDKRFETHPVDSRSNDAPLLMQCRLFHNGIAAKGTLLLNKKLEQGTILIRKHSMIKVKRDDTFKKDDTFNSLEIVNVSCKPGRTALSKYLIALLSYGNVPPEFFLGLLFNALEDCRNVYTNRKSAMRVAAYNDGLHYGFLAQRMISSGIPLNEPYLEHCLWKLKKDESSKLKAGKLPISETFYLMGTADPTGILNYDEVCVILHHGQVSGKVLVYRNPGLHFGDIHVMNAIYLKELEEIVGNAKYGIFFSTKGMRSAPYEIATGDFDGDMYWVSRNPELLKYYQASDPWCRVYSSQNSNNRKPAESSSELEHQLFQLFLEARRPSFTTATAADSWLSFMDRLLTTQCASEKDCLRRKIIQLIDIYYDSLDAPKSGKKVKIPNELKAKQYPHYMQRGADFTYESFSILGQIYSRMEKSKDEASPTKEILKLPNFDVPIHEEYATTWRIRYAEYCKDMAKALKSGSETKNDAADEVIRKYKQMLYDAPDLKESEKNTEQIYEEALAIYHVTYDHAISCNEVRRCGFCWKVAGSALFNIFAWKVAGSKERPLVILPSVLRELLN